MGQPKRDATVDRPLALHPDAREVSVAAAALKPYWRPLEPSPNTVSYCGCTASGKTRRVEGQRRFIDHSPAHKILRPNLRLDRSSDEHADAPQLSEASELPRWRSDESLRIEATAFAGPVPSQTPRN